MAGFTFLHTCYRIGDIDRSVEFYGKLGLVEQRRMPIGDDATNVFLGTEDQRLILELTYNHGVSEYELGTGYGHIALGVPSLDDTLAALAEVGITPEKPPYHAGGNPANSLICFVRDPDNYRIELIQRP